MEYLSRYLILAVFCGMTIVKALSSSEALLKASRKARDGLGGCLPGGTGCYTATSPSPLVQDCGSGCYKGCYKVQQRVLHFSKISENSVKPYAEYSTENSEEPSPPLKVL